MTNLSSTPVVNCGFTARMPMPIFVTTKTYVFLTYLQSMFASFDLDTVSLYLFTVGQSCMHFCLIAKILKLGL